MTNNGLSNVWRAAQVLHANAQTTQRTINDTTRLANAYGFDIEILPQWDTIVCRTRARNDSNDAWQTALLPVRPAGVDMHKVASTNQWIDRVCADPDRQRADHIERDGQALTEIAAYPPSSHARFILMAAIGAVALGVIFGVTSSVTLAMIFIAAALGAVARRLLAKVSDNLLIQPFVAALIAGLVGGYAQHAFSEDGLQFVEIAPCMILVPGAHILNAALDLIRGRLGLGVTRGVYCVLILLSICVGLLLGLSLMGASLASGMASAVTPLWLDVICAGIAVAAFGAFFSLPWRLLAAPVIVGMFCHGSRWIVMEQGAGFATGALVACLIAGTVMTLLSHRLKLPFAALAFASVVSMMPGIFVFRFADGLISVYLAGQHASLAMITAVFADGTATLLIVLVMTFGLIFPKMLIEGLWVKEPSRQGPSI
jgi:uncharacterized membrane protein YjjP (DUF1212 family)